MVLFNYMIRSSIKGTLNGSLMKPDATARTSNHKGSIFMNSSKTNLCTATTKKYYYKCDYFVIIKKKSTFQKLFW